jgi:ankyrin repeat protein
VQENRTQLIPILLENGSDIFATDNSGVTPFDMALQQRGPILDSLITVETARQADSAGNTMLHMAVQAGVNTSVLGDILDKNALLNMRNRDGDTPLHIAARMNQKEAGEFLLDRGADIFSANSQGDSPLRLALTHRSGVLQWMFNPRTVKLTDSTGNTMLHYVALWKMDRQIEFLKQQGIPVDAKNGNGETPLFWAVHHDGASTVRALVSARANINARDSLGNSALHAAVRWNAPNATNTLLDIGMDVNAFSMNGTTPLHDAVRLGNISIAQILINRRANLEMRDSDGNTPFMEAVRSGQAEAVNLLARSGADPMTRNSRGDTPLHIAVAAADSTMINTLLGMGVSIHARNTRNRTPFQIALVDVDATETIPLLLGGGRANSTDDFGNSPLHVAVQERVRPTTLKLIVERSSQSRWNAVDSNGRTPMRLAAELGAWDLAQVLADSGADPFVAAVDGKNAAQIAITSGSFAIEALFSGVAINARDPSGNTVLHLAARIGNRETINTLLALGADINARNMAGESPAEVATRWNNSANAALLN